MKNEKQTMLITKDSLGNIRRISNPTGLDTMITRHFNDPKAFKMNTSTAEKNFHEGGKFLTATILLEPSSPEQHGPEATVILQLKSDSDRFDVAEVGRGSISLCFYGNSEKKNLISALRFFVEELENDNNNSNTK